MNVLVEDHINGVLAAAGHFHVNVLMEFDMPVIATGQLSADESSASYSTMAEDQSLADTMSAVHICLPGDVEAMNLSDEDQINGVLGNSPSAAEGLHTNVLMEFDKPDIAIGRLSAHETSPRYSTMAEDQSLADTMSAVHISLPGDVESCRSFARKTGGMARAASNNNLLYQWMAPGCGVFRSEVQRSLQRGVSQNKRNSLDLAGKLPLTLKMMSLGLRPQDLWIDFSQAGGMYGTDDGMIPSLREMLEVKGAKLKSGTTCHFQIKKISVDGTGWKHLFLVCRRDIWRLVHSFLCA